MLKSVEVSLADLGYAKEAYNGREGHGQVGANGYRAPEVTLGTMPICFR